MEEKFTQEQAQVTYNVHYFQKYDVLYRQYKAQRSASGRGQSESR